MAKKKSSKKKADSAEQPTNSIEEGPNGADLSAVEKTESTTPIENDSESTPNVQSVEHQSDTRPVTEDHNESEAISNADPSDPTAVLDSLTPDNILAEVTEAADVARHENNGAHSPSLKAEAVAEDTTTTSELTNSLDDLTLRKDIDSKEANGEAITETSATLNSSTIPFNDSSETELQELRQALQESRDEQRAMKITMEELNAKADRLIEEKTLAETQYKSLFSKVTQMKTTLGARLKQDSEDLAQNRILIEDLEAQNATLSETVAHMQEQIVNSSESSSSTNAELSRAKKEIESLNSEKQALQEKYDAEKSAHHAALQESTMTAAEWENLAREERSARDNLRDRIVDLEEQLAAQNTAYDNLRGILEQDNQAIAKFKQNIYELQESHQTELRETVDTTQATISQLSADSKSAEERAAALRIEVQSLNTDLEKLRPYEQEVKEKNLLIGKLRHEAVILNEHLTKALRLLKRGSSNDSVDRQLLNNLLLSFFQIPRQDSKRFEVLKVLSSVLAWDDSQKEQAGLLRPGSTNPSLGPLSPNSTRSPPMSPTINRGSMSRRTSGTLQLQAADFIGPNRESMADLWINFLQSEAAMDASEQAQANAS